MMCIVITLPGYLPPALGDEGALITSMLASGVIDRVHIRKPDADAGTVIRLIESVPAPLRARLSLHDHHALAEIYGTGIHLNARHPAAPAGFAGTVSRSCHSLAETALPADYCFLSPVYDSISKTGYGGAFDPAALCGHVDRHVVALGGVTPGRMPELARAGFGGAAFLGYVWRGDVENNIKEIERFRECCSL